MVTAAHKSQKRKRNIRYVAGILKAYSFSFFPILYLEILHREIRHFYYLSNNFVVSNFFNKLHFICRFLTVNKLWMWILLKQRYCVKFQIRDFLEFCAFRDITYYFLLLDITGKPGFPRLYWWHRPPGDLRLHYLKVMFISSFVL